jgi:hypothetical protein
VAEILVVDGNPLEDTSVLGAGTEWWGQDERIRDVGE